MVEHPTPTIVLSTEINPLAHGMIEEQGIRVETFDKKTPLDELADFVNANEAVMLGKRSNPKLSREFLENTGLYAIGCFCKETGIGLEDADELGITIFNSPEGNSDAVAEYVVAAAIALSRGFITGDHMAQRGKWGKRNGQEIAGSTVGLLGFGAAGQRAGQKLHALGANIVFWDLNDTVRSNDFATRLDTADEVIQASDILSLHIPGKGNEGAFGQRQVEMMRDGAILIDSARYEILDPAAIEAALDAGKLGGLAIDVHPMPEPSKFGDDFDSRFAGRDNVLVTSHLAGSGKNAQRGTTAEVAGYLTDFWRTGNTAHSVNMPRIELGPVAVGTRLLLPHRNRPGVVGEIGTLLGRHGINIEGLDSKPKYPIEERHDGLVYSHFDTDGSEFTPEVFEAIEGLDFALRPRVIRARRP